MTDLKEIAKSIYNSYEYAQSLNFKNVPSIIVKSIAKDRYYSYNYVYNLNYENVPLIILKSAINRYYFINGFPKNKHFLLYILKYDKRTNILI